MNLKGFKKISLVCVCIAIGFAALAIPGYASHSAFLKKEVGDDCPCWRNYETFGTKCFIAKEECDRFQKWIYIFGFPVPAGCLPGAYWDNGVSSEHNYKNKGTKFSVGYEVLTKTCPSRQKGSCYTNWRDVCKASPGSPTINGTLDFPYVCWAE